MNAADGIIEPVDVSGDGVFFGLLSGLQSNRPDQLRLDGLEECFHHRVEALISVKGRWHDSLALGSIVGGGLGMIAGTLSPIASLVATGLAVMLMRQLGPRVSIADLADPALKERIAGLKVLRDQARTDADRAQALLESPGHRALILSALLWTG